MRPSFPRGTLASDVRSPAKSPRTPNGLNAEQNRDLVRPKNLPRPAQRGEVDARSASGEVLGRARKCTDVVYHSAPAPHPLPLPAARGEGIRPCAGTTTPGFHGRINSFGVLVPSARRAAMFRPPRRPVGEARRGRILDVCNRGATKPAGTNRVGRRPALPAEARRGRVWRGRAQRGGGRAGGRSRVRS